MEKGQIFEVVIEDMSSEGQGIGRAEGLVVFVPGTVVGDRAQVCLTKVKKNYAFSRLVKVVEASPDRTEEFDCDFLEKGCGGCPYGKLSYSAQLRVKERQVREKLQRLAGLGEPIIKPIIGMEESDNEGSGPFRYRNKAQFPVSTGGIITRKGGIVENLGEPAVGFYRAKSHDVVNCGDCYLQSMAAMAAADALRRFMAEDNITAWDPKWQKGLMRHLIVKTGFATKEVMVILVVNGKGIPNSQKLVEMLDEAIYEVGYSLESVVFSVKKSGAESPEKGSNGKALKGQGSKSSKKIGREIGDNDMIFSHGEIMGDETIVLAGKPVIRDIVGELEFEISPESFYQVNPVQMKRLYDKVREYCGFGAVNNGDVDFLSAGKKAGTDDTRTDNTDSFEVGMSVNIKAGGNDKPSEMMDDNNTIDQNEGVLCDKVIDDKRPIVLDLYCGVGSIGLYCADNAKAVIGIESVKNAVLDANRNAVVNGIVNARYICGRAEEVLPSYLNAAKHGSPDDKGAVIARLIKNANIAILDPPRAGCRPELLEAVAGVSVDRIVYVSCDPATLARDIKLLSEMGYEFVEATPVDMFPWTGHVETVVLMSRTSGIK